MNAINIYDWSLYEAYIGQLEIIIIRLTFANNVGPNTCVSMWELNLLFYCFKQQIIPLRKPRYVNTFIVFCLSFLPQNANDVTECISIDKKFLILALWITVSNKFHIWIETL